MMWTPDTTPAMGSCRKGCDSTRGQSCGYCDGTNAEQWEELLGRRREVEQLWRDRVITAQSYVHLTAAISSDGLPSTSAVKALERENAK